MTKARICRRHPRRRPTKAPSGSCCSTRGAQHSVTSSGISERTLEDGRLEVIAQIRNRENRRIEVQANCVFKDQNGFATGDETPFQALILTENGTEQVRFVSANALAKKYTIRVRQAR